MNDNFKTVVVVDFEYEVDPGGLPTVLCMVAYVLDEFLQLIHVIRLWRGEFGSKPPFDIGPDAVFVAYSAWAEMICFQQLGWPRPKHILDLHTAYLAVSNVLEPYEYAETPHKKPSKDLKAACRAYGIEGWELFDKSTIAADIGNGTGANGGIKLFLSTAKKTFARLPNSCAPCCAATIVMSRLTSCEPSIGPITAPRRLLAFKRAECRSIWSCGTSCRRTRRPWPPNSSAA